MEIKSARQPNLSYRSVLASAWPVIIANAATPLLGLADTAVIGHGASPKGLGALALSVLCFNFLFWACGFLRMSTTGFVAQAVGARAWQSMLQTIFSGLFIAAALSLILVTLQAPLQFAAFSLLQAHTDVEQLSQTYFAIRIWGAPATLCLYVYSGLLIGLGKTRHLLVMQVALNALNIVLDVGLGYGLQMGVRGVALGTVIAEWCVFWVTSGVLFLATRKHFTAFNLTATLRNSLQWHALKPMLSHNRDMFIRTLFLLLSFAWFTNASAAFGTTVLAANHILLQCISFSAFFLDGFAFVAESLVGNSIGAKNKHRLQNSIRLTTHLAASIAVVLSLVFGLLGSDIVATLTVDRATQVQAQQLLPWMALYIALSFAAFQLDGIFIGATQAAAMRNASVLSFLGFMLCYWLLKPFGVQGLWWSFISYVVLRAICLWLQRRVIYTGLPT